MNITILCSSANHPVNTMLQEWISKQEERHEISLARSKRELLPGDLLFLISCSEILTAEDRGKFHKTLVVHASDLPKGRGWSPHVWEVSSGCDEITVTLLEAEEKVDTGDIWRKVCVTIPRHALYDEINMLLFKAESDLMDFAVDSFWDVEPQPQCSSAQPSYYRIRTPADSEIDPAQSLADQFNLLRVCDPVRFPAFFVLCGQRYKVTIEKISDE